MDTNFKPKKWLSFQPEDDVLDIETQDNCNQDSTDLTDEYKEQKQYISNRELLC